MKNSEQNGPPLTSDQAEHLAELNHRFWTANTEKYLKGQREHGGNLWEKDLDSMIHAAKEEVVDQWNYLNVIEEKVADMRSYIARLESDLAGSEADRAKLKENK